MSAIEFKDIRVGDRVRRTGRIGDDVSTLEFTVKRRGRSWIETTAGVGVSQVVRGFEDAGYAWELIERPEPEFKPGQVWEHRPTNARFVTVSDANDRILLVNATTGALSAVCLGSLTYVGEAEIGVKS